MFVCILLITICLFAIVFTISWCKINGKCSRAEEQDEWERKWIEQRKKEEVAATKTEDAIDDRVEGYKWCMDECKYCEQNDWCFFSEVKKKN